MIDIPMIVLIALAIARISAILTNESGPFDLALRFRLLIGVRYFNFGQDAEGNTIIEYLDIDEVFNASKFGTMDQHFLAGDNVFSRLVSCIYCCSVWVSAVLFGIYLGYIGDFVLLNWVIFTFSGSAIAIYFNNKV